MPIPQMTLTTVNTFDVEHVKAIVVAYLKKASGQDGLIDRNIKGLIPAQRWIVDGSTRENQEMMWQKFMPSIEALRNGDDDAFTQHLAELHASGWLSDKQYASKVRAIQF